MPFFSKLKKWRARKSSNCPSQAVYLNPVYPAPQISISTHTGVTSATRRCPLTALPPELSLTILMLFEPEIETFINLFLVDRLFYSFIKSQEARIVMQFAEHHDPLAALLVLRSNPSFPAFSRISKEQKIFDSIMDNMFFRQIHKFHFPDIKDPNFCQSPGSKHVLHAGFLIHHQITSIETRQGKADYAEKLPHEFWALFRVFTRFLDALLRYEAAFAFPQIDYSNSKFDSVRDFIAELAIFSGLKVIRDFMQLNYQSTLIQGLELHYQPVMIQEMELPYLPILIQDVKSLYLWAHTFESRYLPNGDTVLLTDTSMLSNRLKLSSYLSFTIGDTSHTYFGAKSKSDIRIGTTEISGYGDDIYDEVLSLAGILPAYQDKKGLLTTLSKIKADQRRYRVIKIDGSEDWWVDY